MKLTRRRVLASVLMITLGLSLHIAWREHSGSGEVVDPTLRAHRSSVDGISPGTQARAVPGAGSDLSRDPLVDAQVDPFKVVHFGVTAPIVTVPVAAPSVVESKRVMPPFPYRYFGRMVTAEGITLTFLAREDSLVPVKAAAILDDVYRVDSISDKEVLLTYLPLNEQITVQAQSGAQ